uniref:GPI inositol-deacylase n=1 Tax=Chlamydomonas euryale TaxID=1486919 RepID=A0A7R9V257_9CHLO
MSPAAPSFMLPLHSCWPTDWLAADFPTARMLTIEYPAPFTNTEVESPPLEETAARLTQQLLAAGVGQRPIVFVCHSMGGLLIKEVLAQALAEAVHEEWMDARPHTQLIQNTFGVLFYATPHFGSNLAAMGWRLRSIPGAPRPAPSLARLTPGPHLLELNAVLESLHTQHGLRVVSMLEGKATEVAVLPRMYIVPEESGYPGFGERIVLVDDDHVQLCKPASRSAPGYVSVYSLVADAIAAARRQHHYEGVDVQAHVEAQEPF